MKTHYILPGEKPPIDHTRMTFAGVIAGFMMGVTFLIVADLIARLIILN